MERMTLRQAAERTARSITTLRRYIRRGRLRAEKQNGRYGPEYFVSREDLAEAGLEFESAESHLPEPIRQETTAIALERAFQTTIPLGLYQELQMKHEQLLVQYGMVRVGGLRVLDLQGELEAKRHQLEEGQAELARLEEKLQRETSNLRKRLRQSELEREGRRLENAALKEKVRGLEMLTRNAITNESVDRQFSRVEEQIRRVDKLDRPSGDLVSRPWRTLTPKKDKPDH